MSAPSLEIRDLSIDFRTPRGRMHAVRNASFSVPEGRIVGLVGESGCGKSTVGSSSMRLLSDNAEIVSGSIMFEGREMASLSEGELRNLRGQRLSMIFQDPMTSLNPVLKIGRQMMDAQDRSGRSRREKRERSRQMLERVGIPDAESRLDSYPHEFSGGMRQRISIAMALQSEPSLLIADEPTTALDATLEVQIIDLLQELQEEFDCAILFISHHLGVIAELCNDVVVMYAGEVAETGTVRDIFKRPSHPYTRKLLECDPARIGEPSRDLPTIPGDLPDLVNVPQGCIFADRCPYVFDRCLREKPPPYAAPTGHDEEDGLPHRATCHLLDPAEEKSLPPLETIE